MRSLLEESWGAANVITRGRVYAADRLPGFAAWSGARPVGLVTYHISNQECEIISLNGVMEGQGIGTALITAVKHAAIERGCRRLWLITTNDNSRALAFYQKRGFHLCALYPNAITESRRIKPEIPQMGINGIPIRDELELEIRL